MLPTSLPTDSYLTDGTRLFRVMATVADPWKGESVALENCLTLESKIYPRAALGLLNLEYVRAARPPSAAPGEPLEPPLAGLLAS